MTLSQTTKNPEIEGGKEITTALIVVAVVVFFGAVIHFIPNKRKREIQEILSDLRSIKSDPDYKEAAALNI